METTAERTMNERWNGGNLPPEGHEDVGRHFIKLWETARDHKIEYLKMHDRFMDLHTRWRGKKKKTKYPTVGANYIFKTVDTFCAVLTEKSPASEIESDSPQEDVTKALDKDSQDWWSEESQQDELYASVLNMMIYGTTIEKGRYDPKRNVVEIIVLDPYNFFPAPGGKRCNIRLPYVCDVDFLEPWEIQSTFGVPVEVQIPTDAEETLLGLSRETAAGGLIKKSTSNRHYQSQFADYDNKGNSPVKGKTLVIEIWCVDERAVEQPIIQQVPIMDDMGRPAMNPDGSPVTQEQESGSEIVKIYPDGIRKVTICPALHNSYQGGVLDDSMNPNVNWSLIDQRIQAMVQEGRPEPVADPMTGQPAVDTMTGQTIMQAIPVSPAEAETEVYKQASKSMFLWGRYPYSATPSKIDTSQWWGFSIIEQLEELQGKAEELLTKYFSFFDRAMFPPLILPNVGDYAPKGQLTNEPGMVLRPPIEVAPHIRFVPPPQAPSGFLELLQFVLMQHDIVSGSPEVTEGRRPTGISAASAIVALQDKAATLFQPQIRQIDRLIINRGRMWVHFTQNFGTEEKPVKVDEQIVKFLGVNLWEAYKYTVESGSSAPVTKAGRRNQLVELRKTGDMDRKTLLESLEIPNVDLIIERLAEEKAAGALDILIESGLPPEVAQQLMGMIQQRQTPEGGKKAGGYSEGMNNAQARKAELTGE